MAGLSLVLSVGSLGAAQTWKRLGPEGGMVVSLATGSGGGLYLGTADGHVFFSKDGAQSWELRGRVGKRLDAVVTRLIPDASAENRIFASVWYQAAGAGGGVFQSNDGGRSWTLLGLKEEAVRALEVAPSQPEILVAGTRSGVFRSGDQGKNWRRISPPDDAELRNVDSLAIDPQNADNIYVGTYHLPWRTQDAGKTWTPVIAGIIDDSDIMSLRIDATNPARLFMSACSGIYRSENRGAQWVKLQGIPYSARRTQAIVQDPGNPQTLYAGTTEGLWVTRDAGESWARTTSKDWNINSVVVVSIREGKERVVLGTEGRGVQVSDDAGVHFDGANHGFTHVVVKQLLADPNRPGYFLMVVELAEAKILETRDAGRTWQLLSPSEGHAKALKWSADQLNRAYASPWGWLLQMENGQFWLCDADKQTWTEWKLRLSGSQASGKAGTPGKAINSHALELQNLGAPMAFTANAALVPTSAGLLHCLSSGTCNVLRAFGHGGPIRAVSVSADGHDVLVARDGKLGISDNGGGTAVWRDLPVSLDAVIWLQPGDSGAKEGLFLGTTNGLYVTHGQADSWMRVEEGLPAAPVTHWLQTSDSFVAAERDGGLYISKDRGAHWQRVDRDSERGEFNGLVSAGPGRILGGSQSEGLLQLELHTEQAAPSE